MPERTPRIDLRKKGYQFRVNSQLLDRIEADLGVDKLMAQVGSNTDITAVGKLCSKHGTALAQKIIEDSKKYPDRTYEVIQQVAAQTKMGPFPHQVQRFLEIAYLSLLRMPKLKIAQSWAPLLTYEIDSCKIYEGLRGNLGKERMKGMPCQGLCLELARGVLDSFELDAVVTADVTMASNNCCRFTAALRKRLPMVAAQQMRVES